MKRRILISILAALVIALPFATPSRAAEETGPKDFITSLATHAIESLTKGTVSRPQKVDNFRALFRDHFAVKGIGKWVLGRYWRRATDDQKSEYLTLFEDLMVVSYVDRFADYAGEQLVIVKSLPNNKTMSTVYSEILRPGSSKPIRVDWRVSKTNAGDFKIVDVVVEGTSMSATLRSDFKSIIRQNGGQVAGLLVALRAKTASLKTETAENKAKP